MRRPWAAKSLETLEAVRARLIALERRYRRELVELAWAIREAVREPGHDRNRLAAVLGPRERRTVRTRSPTTAASLRCR